MNPFPMTRRGAEKLREELNHLKGQERPKVIEAIAEAREHGDLKENAEYHAAREQQGFIEGRIAEIEAKLSHARIIDVSEMKNDGRVIFGSTVVLLNLEDEKQVKYQIVGDDEADVKEERISVSSPIARACIGKMEGDEITVQAPGGEIDYEILEVKYV